jgi:hypothetical protein
VWQSKVEKVAGVFKGGEGDEAGSEHVGSRNARESKEKKLVSKRMEKP